MKDQFVFFSYSRSDSEFVLNLAKELREDGITVWLDQLDIKPGMRWDKSIEKALDKATTVILVLSNASVASDNVMDEVSFAIEEDKTVVPIMLEKCDVPFRLRRFQFIDFSENHEKAKATLESALAMTPKATVLSDTKPKEAAKPKATATKETTEKSKSKTPTYAVIGLVVLLILLYFAGVFDGEQAADNASDGNVDQGEPTEMMTSTNEDSNEQVINGFNLDPDGAIYGQDNLGIWNEAIQTNTDLAYMRYIEETGPFDPRFDLARKLIYNTYEYQATVVYRDPEGNTLFNKVLFYNSAGQWALGEGDDTTVPKADDILITNQDVYIYHPETGEQIEGSYIPSGKLVWVYSLTTTADGYLFASIAY